MNHLVTAALCLMFQGCSSGGLFTSGIEETASPGGQADMAARQLLDELGPQQTYARLGWQQNPDYEPPKHCFDHWCGREGAPLDEVAIADCEQHASDLSRLYASFSTDAPPLIFKSEYYWDSWTAYNEIYPDLVSQWEAAGGTQDDESFLDHPICADTIQQGWTGSEYFYDGSAHPICQALMVEAREAQE